MTLSEQIAALERQVAGLADLLSELETLQQRIKRARAAKQTVERLTRLLGAGEASPRERAPRSRPRTDVPPPVPLPPQRPLRHAAALLRLAAAGSVPTHTLRDGLGRSEAVTGEALRALVRHGLLERHRTPRGHAYSLSPAGVDHLESLEGERDALPPPAQICIPSDEEADWRWRPLPPAPADPVSPGSEPEARPEDDLEPDREDDTAPREPDVAFEPAPSSLERDLLEVLYTAAEERSPRELARDLGEKTAQVKAALARLYKAGQLTRTGYGLGGLPYRYTLSPQARAGHRLGPGALTSGAGTAGLRRERLTRLLERSPRPLSARSLARMLGCGLAQVERDLALLGPLTFAPVPGERVA